jgi:hypothetical protein
MTILLLWAHLLAAQTSAKMMYVQEEEQLRFDSLKTLYGRHKKLPAGYELPALVALSYYPELQHKHIKFVIKKHDLPYSSRPRLWSLLVPFVPLRYVIIISTDAGVVREPTLLHHLPFNAQIGALGHELAHTSYYARTRKWQVLKDGLHYSDPVFKEKFEKMTDRIAIQHGLGPQLYAWCGLVYPVKLKDGIRAKIYYSPEEILQIWQGQ